MTINTQRIFYDNEEKYTDLSGLTCSVKKMILWDDAIRGRLHFFPVDRTEREKTKIDFNNKITVTCQQTQAVIKYKFKESPQNDLFTKVIMLVNETSTFPIQINVQLNPDFIHQFSERVKNIRDRLIVLDLDVLAFLNENHCTFTITKTSQISDVKFHPFENFVWISHVNRSTVNLYHLNKDKLETVFTIGVEGHRDFMDVPAATKNTLPGYLSSPKGLAVNGNSKVYICDSGNGCIREADIKKGYLRTLCGNPKGSLTDNPGTSSQLNDPTDCALDKNCEKLFFTDSDTIRYYQFNTKTLVTIKTQTLGMDIFCSKKDLNYLVPSKSYFETINLNNDKLIVNEHNAKYKFTQTKAMDVDILTGNVYVLNSYTVDVQDNSNKKNQPPRKKIIQEITESKGTKIAGSDLIRTKLKILNFTVSFLRKSCGLSHIQRMDTLSENVSYFLLGNFFGIKSKNEIFSSAIDRTTLGKFNFTKYLDEFCEDDEFQSKNDFDRFIETCKAQAKEKLIKKS